MTPPLAVRGLSLPLTLILFLPLNLPLFAVAVAAPPIPYWGQGSDARNRTAGTVPLPALPAPLTWIAYGTPRRSRK